MHNCNPNCDILPTISIIITFCTVVVNFRYVAFVLFFSEIHDIHFTKCHSIQNYIQIETTILNK